ncbi:MAG TPA: hypothetical protein VHM01_22230 [Alphaproteobacteria bacterium]|nr:hypothetical protein [Alphaproteobacteria bacterium]
MSRLSPGQAVQVLVNAPARYHPLARGVLRRSRVVTDDPLGGLGGANTVLWTVETSEGATFEAPEVYLARIEEE